MTITAEQIPDGVVEAVALAMSKVEWCGAQIDGVQCLCDDPRIPEDVRQDECLCRKQAPTAIITIFDAWPGVFKYKGRYGQSISLPLPQETNHE